MGRRTNAAALALAGLACGTVARAADPNVFDAVHDGVVTVYAIGEVTTVIHDYTPPSEPEPTPDWLADQTAKLIRDVVSPELWTTAGGTGAAMRVTPAQLTVKAPPETHKQIAALLAKLREARQDFMQEEYRIVDSDAVRQYYADYGNGNRLVYLDQKTIDAVAAEDRPVLAKSEQTPRNGQNVLWLDGTGLELPTLTATATAAYSKNDPKYAVFGQYVTVTVRASATATPSGAVPAFQTTFTNASGGTAAVPLDDGLTRWLLVKVTVQKR